MYSGKTVFAQIMESIPHYRFQQLVARYQGSKWIQSFSCWEQYLAMAFAQFTGRRSLRDIEHSLNAQRHKLYHMGFRSLVKRPTLAIANQNRDFRIYRDLACYLIEKACPLYADEDLGLDLKNTAYALDATTIDLSLTLFPWAKFRRTKSAVKLHTLLDLQGSIPRFVDITSARVHDVNILDQILFEPGSIIIMDRGYLDFKRLYRLDRGLAFFIIRARKNLRFKRIYSNQPAILSDVQCDQTIRLTGVNSSQYYPDHLRRIRYKDIETGKRLVFLTNNFLLSAETIADLYRYRWQIELFFKWIKQHLHIMAFYGTSENAVKTQIWIAISVYVLVAIFKKEHGIASSLYIILQILSVSLFEKVPILQLFKNNHCKIVTEHNHNQLSFLD